MSKKLATWNTKHLSFDGRITLIKYALPIFPSIPYPSSRNRKEQHSNSKPYKTVPLERKFGIHTLLIKWDSSLDLKKRKALVVMAFFKEIRLYWVNSYGDFP